MTRIALAVACSAVLVCCGSFGSDTPESVNDAGADGQAQSDDASAGRDVDVLADAGDSGAPGGAGVFCREQKVALAEKLLGCADFDGSSMAFTEKSAGLELSPLALEAFGREPSALSIVGSRNGTLVRGGLERANVPAPASGKTVSARFLMKVNALVSKNSGSAGFADVVGIVAAGESAPFLNVRLENPDAFPDRYRAKINDYYLDATADKTFGTAVVVELFVRRDSVNGIAIGGSVGASVLPEKQLAQNDTVTSWTVYIGAELNQGEANVEVAIDDVVIVTD